MASFNFVSFIRNSKVDPDRPSIFPIIASLNFKKELPKAFQHVTWYLAEAYPGKFLWLHRFSDELYLVLDAIVSLTYLNIHKGLLTENFYGLRRIEKATKFVSLIHVIIPYLLNKLENRAKDRLENLDDKISVSIEALNGILQTIYNLLNLILNILYSSGLSRYPSVLHCFDNAELKHISAQDVNKSEEKLSQMPKIVQKTQWLISVLLETSAFGLQFVEYWYNDTILSKPSVLDTSNSTPDPPNALAVEYLNKCPLCRSSRIQASTLLTTCGYVFCYHCIKSYIDETSTCPISGVSANNEHLVRIFSK